MIQATQLRPGMIIVHEKDLYRITAVHHLTPGNKRGFMQTKMKSLRTGVGTEYKFRSEDRVDQAILQTRQMQYLYAEGDMHTFMDTILRADGVLGRSHRGFTFVLAAEPCGGSGIVRGQTCGYQPAIYCRFGSHRYGTVDERRHRERFLQTCEARDGRYDSGAAVRSNR